MNKMLPLFNFFKNELLKKQVIKVDNKFNSQRHTDKTEVIKLPEDFSVTTMGIPLVAWRTFSSGKIYII